MLSCIPQLNSPFSKMLLSQVCLQTDGCFATQQKSHKTLKVVDPICRYP